MHFQISYSWSQIPIPSTTYLEVVTFSLVVLLKSKGIEQYATITESFNWIHTCFRFGTYHDQKNGLNADLMLVAEENAYALK